jgi:DNA polymerase-3 subunit epsilon
LFNFRLRKKPKYRDKRIDTTHFVVIDTELTGLNEKKDSIVSIAAVRMTGGRISVGDPLYRLIKPRAELKRESVIIHGITPSDVAAERNSASVLAEFLEFCSSGVVVGHCVAIDLEFIDRETKRVLGTRFENELLDTAEIYRWIVKRGLLEQSLPSPPKVPDLYQLAACFDIEVSEAHHALGDAFTTAQLFQRFLPIISKGGVNTIGELMSIGTPFKSGKFFLQPNEFSF